ncbi:MAG: hypothetical protein J1G38_00680 [Clostridiales bacterium]|nr:hypothetical protein [Clostridiales bacterium]
MKKKMCMIALAALLAFSATGLTACKTGDHDLENPNKPADGEWSDWNDWNDWDEGFADNYTEFVPGFDFYSGMKVEAEDTKYNDCNETDGGTGKILDWTSDDTKLKFSLSVGEKSSVELLVRVAVDFADGRSRNIADRLALTLNGDEVTLDGQFTQNYNGNWWESYYLVSLGEITLPSGEVAVELKLSDSLNIDFLKFGNTFNFTGSGFIVQAEDANSSGCNVSSGGSGKVLDWTNDNTKVEFDLAVDEQTTVELFVRVAVDFSNGRSRNIADRLELKLNGQKVMIGGQFMQDYDGDWWESYYLVLIGNITLSKGNNAVELKLSDSLNLDYIQFGADAE